MNDKDKQLIWEAYSTPITEGRSPQTDEDWAWIDNREEELEREYPDRGYDDWPYGGPRAVATQEWEDQQTQELSDEEKVQVQRDVENTIEVFLREPKRWHYAKDDFINLRDGEDIDPDIKSRYNLWQQEDFVKLIDTIENQ
jgi:hypothetical protein